MVSDNGNSVKINDNPLGHGGEANVYEVINQNNVIFKHYHESKTDLYLQKKEQKIRYLISNSPFKKQSQYKVLSKFVAWPDNMVYKSNKFIGYTMKRVEGAGTLKILSTPKLRKKYSNEKDWQKWDRSKSESISKRLQLCANLASLIDAIHCTGKFVIIDLKPANLLVTPKGIISLIDLDSIQIHDGSTFFKTDAYTDDYAPPEWHKAKDKLDKNPIDKSWDYFAFAVLAYEILIGSNPFHGKVIGRDNTLPAEMIKEGLFRFGKNAHLISQTNKRHAHFLQLPLPIQQLFIKCFDEGHIDPTQRPNLQEWRDTLVNESVLSRLNLGHVKKSFSVDHRKICAGEKITLKWDVEKSVTKVELNQIPVLHCDLRSIKLLKSETFELNGKLGNGQKISLGKINIQVEKPPIVDFTVNVNSVLLGDPIVLNWKVNYSHQVDISSIGSNLLHHDSIKIIPSDNTVYQLKAYWFGKAIIREIEVKVIKAPQVVFECSEHLVYIGELITLTWDIPQASSINISLVGNDLLQSGTVELDSVKILSLAQKTTVSNLYQIVILLQYEWNGHSMNKEILIHIKKEVMQRKNNDVILRKSEQINRRLHKLEKFNRKYK